MLKLDYKSDKPLHEQITAGIKNLVIRGVLKQDEQLPSVRDLSVELTVNPNTVQRAYKTLESEGVIYSIRGKGNFVSETPEADRKTLDALYKTLKETVRELAWLEQSPEKIKSVIDEIYKERNDMSD